MNRILRNLKRRSNKKRNVMIDPDEIFLDSKNLPQFDTQQFEGQFERPVSRQSIISVGILFCVVVFVFGCRLWVLEISDGQKYKKMSENNSLSGEPIFSARGNIYDRNGVPLAWNNTKTDDSPWGERMYIDKPGFSHVLGYVSYPIKDSSGNYWQTKISGKDGVEKIYDDSLQGKNGSSIVERDITGHLQGGIMVNPPENGKNLTLSVDSRLQSELYEVIKKSVQDKKFRSGGGVVMDINTGEVVALTNYPEYDSSVMSLAKDTAKIKGYLTSSLTPLLDRVVSGLYTPGSTVKPYIALEALNEKVIDPNKKIESRGSISIPNQYDPTKPSVFRDYNPDNGWVDMRHAIELSSNIYFFEIGGGYKSQKGIGVYNINKAWNRFGMDQTTGIDLPRENQGTFPNPEWKEKNFPGEPWRLGDTYNTAIGQYGVQETPIEMVRAVAGIARRGVLVNPHVLKEIPTVEKKITDLPDSFYQIIQEGMRLGAIHGTTPDVTPVPFTLATKSGTAQVGPGGINVNSWMTGFFPYEKPHYAFAIMLENGPAPAIGTAHRATREFLGWVGENAPEYGQ